jgi:hypothetical protein
MATMQLYGKVGANFLGGEAGGDAFQMDYLSDTIKATLHTATYTPNIDTNEVFADATNELGTANGYTAGGQALGSKTVSYNSTGNVTTFSAADFSWTASGGSLVFQHVVIWDDTIASDPLIGYIDVGAQTITTGNTFTIDITASGLFTATVT